MSVTRELFPKRKANNVKLIHGDCIEEMKKMPDNSVDSVVTDP